MKAISVLYRRLTNAEFNATSGIVSQTNGGGQTYFDFPSGPDSVPDADMQEFFNHINPSQNQHGNVWDFNVTNLRLLEEQKATISARSSSRNSLRNQQIGKAERFKIFNPDNGFPTTYDDSVNPIVIYIIKDENNGYWCGWFYLNDYNPETWHITLDLAQMWDPKKNCKCIKLSRSIVFCKHVSDWPFGKSDNYFEQQKQKSLEKAVESGYKTTIRTKPFLLLAGISGTGKSRIVRELAFKSCPKYLQDKDGTTPGNYCMIEVKPNWHDSTELLGYYSNLSKGYQFKKFVQFLVKAKMNPEVPFFVCLDEMNLAPVEQYFAEILSILETRKHPKNSAGEVDMSVIKSGVIIEGKHFSQVYQKDMGGVISTVEKRISDGDWYASFFKESQMSEEEKAIVQKNRSEFTLCDEGLTLPDNVVIIGTVNMDDTTHQFSRKVIDRAMTIEMNGGKLKNMFGGSNNLAYLEEEEQKKWQAAFKQEYVSADEVLAAHPNEADKIVEMLPEKLEAINAALKGTPFEVSYRVLNELTIMMGVMIDDTPDEELETIVNNALDRILLMKILPRIEGDSDMFNLKTAQTVGGVTCHNRLEWLRELAPNINYSEEEGKDHQQTAKEKIEEMIERLENQEFTRFWP